jgi:hypothetical protein
MKKITLVESGKAEGGHVGKDLTLAFSDEQDAWEFCLRRWKIKHWRRQNLDKIKGFRALFYTTKRWVLMTNIELR